MALNPAQLMMQRSGPAVGPGAAPGAPTPDVGAAPGPADASGGADPASIIRNAISSQMNQQRTADHGFASKSLAQQMRVISVMVVHLQQQMPDVAADLNAAWAKLKAAKDKMDKHAESQNTGAHPPLGFSGAAMGQSQVGNSGSVMGQS